MSDAESPGPQFVSAIRGYDRLQVDEYIASLFAWMQDASDRAQRAEAENAQLKVRLAECEREIASEPPRTSDQAAQRVSQMLADASRIAETIRLAAEDEAQQLREQVARARAEADAEFDEIRRERALADGDAARLVDEARREAENIVAAAHAEHAAVVQRAHRDVRRLRKQRDAVVEGLRQLGQAIDDLAPRGSDEAETAEVDLRELQPAAVDAPA
jgi:cell division septum initiation protein DivIVA